MSNFEYSSDRLEERGFIDMKTILEYVSQEDIFQLVFGFQPVEYQYITSPFREDSAPGCWFEYDHKGFLKFYDFANTKKYGHIRLKDLNCFDAVQVYYKLGNFYQTLRFVYRALIQGKSLQKIQHEKIVLDKSEKPPVSIKFTARKFDSRDAKYWSQYKISSDNLIQDSVFAVKKFGMYNTRNGDIVQRPKDICYAYTKFNNGRKKLYLPKRKGRKRFLTNCTRNDIGAMESLIPYGEMLIITKSYKDYRVLRNKGKNCLWLQNEGMMPELNVMVNLCKRFDKTLIWFDNDAPGINAAKKVSGLIQQQIPTRIIQPKWLNPDLLKVGVKDPADVIHKLGEKDLVTILNTM